MDQSIYDLGRAQYRDAIGISDMDRDADGFLVLRPTAQHVDKRVASLTTDIDTLEEKLRQFRDEKAKAVKYQKTEEYRESKKKDKDKKAKKARNTLLEMVFNNADAVNAEAETEEEDDENYRDSKKKGPKKTTLDTTYGKRFAPVVSMLYDTISDFDRIAREIDEELRSSRGQTRGMYRSSQIGNYITAKNSRLSAVKELGSIAKTVSDLEYKRDKDKKAAEGSDTTKAITSLGAKYLRGSFGIMDEVTSDSGKKGKGKDKGKGKKKSGSNFSKSSKDMGYDPDDDDEEDSVRRAKNTASDSDLARELASTVLKRKGDLSFSPHERHLSVEGKYIFVVAVDPTDPEHTWKFLAVDPKTGKEIKGFKDEYKELFPKKKNVRLRFDVNKKKATDQNTSKTYKLVFTD
ncbi:MAG: hypothetical protein NC489_16570 [Ruminococcus flavefaciens]|nr:hypothetical protein [Ruminococcus flavefaciens]